MRGFIQIALAFSLLLFAFFVFLLWVSDGDITAYIGKESFLTSFAASFAQDILFFGGIGALLTYVTTQKPSQMRLDRRIGAVVNGTENQRSARLYVEEQVADLLSYTEIAELKFVLNDTPRNRRKETFLCKVSFKQEIRNMCKDVDFLVKWTHSVQPGKSVNGSCGQVVRLNVKDQKGQEIFSLRDKLPQPIRRGAVQNFPVSFPIQKDSKVVSEYGFEIFDEARNSCADNGNTVYCTLQRFTVVCDVFVENSCSRSIVVITKDGRCHTIQKGGTGHIYQIANGSPGDRIPISVLPSTDT